MSNFPAHIGHDFNKYNAGYSANDAYTLISARNIQYNEVLTCYDFLSRSVFTRVANNTVTVKSFAETDPDTLELMRDKLVELNSKEKNPQIPDIKKICVEEMLVNIADIEKSKKRFEKYDECTLLVEQFIRRSAAHKSVFKVLTCYDFVARSVTFIFDNKNGVTKTFNETDRYVLELMRAKLIEMGGSPPELPASPVETTPLKRHKGGPQHG